MQIKALTLWQPWASLVALGAKKIETRSWPFPCETPSLVAVHAGKWWTRDLYNTATWSPFREVLLAHGVVFPRPAAGSHRVPKPDLPFGAVIALAVVGDCRPTHEVLAQGGEAFGRSDEYKFGNYGRERYAWIFKAVRKLERPVEVTGHQALWDWTVPPDLLPLAEELSACG